MCAPHDASTSDILYWFSIDCGPEWAPVVRVLKSQPLTKTLRVLSQRNSLVSLWSSFHKSLTMLKTILLTLLSAMAVTAAPPTGYRTVYMTSMQDQKFVIVPRSRVVGATLVVYVAESFITAHNLWTRTLIVRPANKPSQTISNIEAWSDVVHQGQLNKYSVGRYNALHGCWSQEHLERYGQCLSAWMCGHGTAKMECYARREDCTSCQQWYS